MNLLKFAVHLPLAQSGETVVSSTPTFHPPTPYWMPNWAWYTMLGVFLLLACGAAVYLYRAQRKIASRRIIIALTTLRTLLILLMFVALLGAGYQFTHTGASNGTLWLMLDQSGSMAQTDPQSTPLEKLRWADALGYLPDGTRASPLGREAARLDVLREDLARLRMTAAVPVEDKDAKARTADVARRLRKWNEQLAAAADAVEKDPAGKADAKALQLLRTTVTQVAKSADVVETRDKPDQAIADVPWKDASAALTSAVLALRDSADKADAQLARTPAAAPAMEKAAALSRAERAKLLLTTRKPDKKSKPDADKAAPGGFEQLIPKQKLKVLAFGEQPRVVVPDRGEDGADAAIKTTLAKPAAPATDIASGLYLIGDQVSASEPSSVVLFSDGRDNRNSADLAESARRLASRGIRVYTVALGSQEVVPDAAVEKIDAPHWVFKGDVLRLGALLRVDGLYKKDDSGGYQGPKKSITVEFHRSQTVDGAVDDQVIDTRQIEVDVPPRGAPNSVRVPVNFTEKKESLPDPGLYDYRVEIKDVPDEVVTANNSQVVRVAVKEHKLAALMIEDQPRWEYRYVANYLGRDNRVKLQTVLFQAARIEKITPPHPVKASPDNEKTEAQILPETQEEWYKFDLIVIGDVPPELLNRKQQEMIAKAVTDRGATLILMAGPLNMPGNWGFNAAQNPLAELLPVEPNPQWTPAVLQARLKSGYRPAIAPEGHDHLLTQFSIGDEGNDKLWAAMAANQDVPTDALNWFWHSEFTQAKSGAQVIWQIADNDPALAKSDAPPTSDARASSRGAEPTAYEAANKRALLATMNLGLGKVMYLAGDATWRLRQVKGQNLHERFWGQVVRWVVGNDLPAGGQYVRFGADKPRYVDGEAALVTARISGKDLAPLKGQKIKVVARQVKPPAGATRPSGASSPSAAPARVEAEMVETPEAPGQYRAVLANLPAGQVELSLVGGDVQSLLDEDKTALQKTLTIEVEKGLNLEQKNLNADRGALAAIAEAGGGAMVEGYNADVLADSIPELNYQVTSAEQIGLFADPQDPFTRYTHYAFLGLFVALISAEWILRRVGGLV